MHGRVGDSPIIGAALYVDNEVGAATATGHGEEVIRIAGCHTVVELMRQGHEPEEACRKAVERIIGAAAKRNKDLKELQIGFIAISKAGNYGGYCLQKGFQFAVYTPEVNNQLVDAKHIL
jgi:N4-(beta-N-acetylglucosaminyl)-L-asparaginase